MSSFQTSTSYNDESLREAMASDLPPPSQTGQSGQSGSRSVSPSLKGKEREQQPSGNWLWRQWQTGTGWFAPLIPPEEPEVLAEKQRQAEAQRYKEKMASVHSWRPSDSSTPSSSSSAPTRPSLMKRLSSAVELKWWPGDAPAPQETEQGTEGGEDAYGRPVKTVGGRLRASSTASNLAGVGESHGDMEEEEEERSAQGGGKGGEGIQMR